MRVIALLYPKPSQLLLSGIIAGYKVKMSKRTSRTKETWNNYAYLEFGVDFVLNRPQYKFQLDEKPQRAFLVTPFEKVSR